MKPYLSIIIPAHNEAKRISLTLVDVDRFLKSVNYPYEIIVVDNGSSDATCDILESLKESIPHIRVMTGKGGEGKGYAVKLGMLGAEGRYRLFMDADNATKIDEFSGMIEYLGNGYDIVIGSRHLKGSVIDLPQPLWKRILGRIGDQLIRLVVLPKVKDTQCGFKVFSEEAARKIFKNVSLGGWGFDFESLAIGKALGFKIKEVPVRWRDGGESKVGPKSYFATLYDLIRVRLNLWFGIYNS